MTMQIGPALTSAVASQQTLGSAHPGTVGQPGRGITATRPPLWSKTQLQFRARFPTNSAATPLQSSAATAAQVAVQSPIRTVTVGMGVGFPEGKAVGIRLTGDGEGGAVGAGDAQAARRPNSVTNTIRLMVLPFIGHALRWSRSAFNVTPRAVRSPADAEHGHGGGGESRQRDDRRTGVGRRRQGRRFR